MRGKKAQSVAEVVKMKRAAKGDEKVAVEKRVYLHVEAEARTTTSKLPKGVFWYSKVCSVSPRAWPESGGLGADGWGEKEWSVGRVLDQAANHLGVKNENSMADSEERRLRVFHVEGGRILSFGEKIGDVAVDGNTIVLLRGVQMPDLLV